MPIGREKFTIVNNDASDAIIGTFNGLPEGAIIGNYLGSGKNPNITYQGGIGGNDVVISFNTALTAVVLTNPILTLAENTSTTTRIKVADIILTDDALGSETLFLTGSDSDRFVISVGNGGPELHIKSGVVLDFDTKPSYSVSINVDDNTVRVTPDASVGYNLELTNISDAIVIHRGVFYNRSSSIIFGNGSGNPINAIDSMKSALLPGQFSAFANYTNYAKGLNGLYVDVSNLPSKATTADLEFAIWDGISPAGFAALAAVSTITVLPGVGIGNSGRLKIEFADNAIRNTWLRVTILANENTDLATNDVFYFGNAIGDMYAGNVGSPITVRTNATDTSIVRQNQCISSNSVGITSVHDINKDGRVNATDTSIVRQNQLNSIIRFFTAPPSSQLDAGVALLGFTDSQIPPIKLATIPTSNDEIRDSIGLLTSIDNKPLITPPTLIAKAGANLDRWFAEEVRANPRSTVATDESDPTRWKESIDQYFSLFGNRLIN